MNFMSVCHPAIAASFAVMLGAGDAKANWKAGQLLNACERLDRSLKLSGDSVEFIQDFETNYCWGFMSAMQQTSSMFVDGKSILMSCVPPTATLTQLIKVYISWGNRNPAKLHEPAAASVTHAFLEAFPCGKK
jgi:hypothetical protein